MHQEQKSLSAVFPLRTSFFYQKVGKLNTFIQSALATSKKGLFVTYGAIIEEGMEKKTVNNTNDVGDSEQQDFQI